MRDQKLFLDGTWVDGVDVLEVHDPFDQTLVGTFAVASPEQAVEAVTAATAAMRAGWSAAARGLDPAAPVDRSGDVRVAGTIGYASLRGGTVAGDHDVVFAGPSERLVLSHRAESRAIFARGALAAARWIAHRPPGVYGMADVLDLA